MSWLVWSGAQWVWGGVKYLAGRSKGDDEPPSVVLVPPLFERGDIKARSRREAVQTASCCMHHVVPGLLPEAIARMHC